MNEMFASRLPDSIIKRLSLRARELDAINLGQGIPSFPTARHIIDAAKISLEDPIIGVYPNFLGEIALRMSLAAKLNSQCHTKLTGEDDILVTVGAMEGTASVVLGMVANGDRVGIISPNYCNHMPQVLLARGVMVELPMQETDRWTIDLPYVEKEMKKGMKLLILTNPSNPTGAVCTRDMLEKLVKLAKTYGTWILADETYSFNTYETSFTSLLEFYDSYNQIVVVRSFSKEYAMTGWRVGYLIARPEPMRVFTKVHDALVGTAPKISQRAALSAVTGPQDIVSSYRDAFHKRRDMACHIIDEAKLPGVSYCRPLGAYYLFLKYPGYVRSVDVSERLLTEAKVAVIPGSAFGRGGEHHVRISFAVDEDVLREGLDRMIHFFT